MRIFSQVSILLITLGLLVAKAEDNTAIRTTFIVPWMKAVQAKDTEGVKRVIHPQVLACINDQNHEYFDNILGTETRFEGKKPYKIVQILPLLGPPPEWLPADSFAYPVQPSYQVEVQLGDVTLVRYLAPVKNSWYEVYPCPNEKGMAMMHERMAKAREQQRRVEQLVADLKEPLLAELKGLLDQKRVVDAVKKYREASGTDLTTAKMVIDVLRTP